MKLLVDVWRESSRYAELEDALQWIAKAVRGHLPTDLLVLRRIDPEHRTLDTVAAGGFTDRRSAGSARRTEVPSPVLSNLLAWFRAGVLARMQAGFGDVLADVLVPRGLGSPCVAGPLAGPGGPIGEVYDNCFVMRFDRDGRCREFTEWFMKRPGA